jgi:hypothetical protein
VRHYRSHEGEALRRRANRRRKDASTAISAGGRGYKGRQVHRALVRARAAGLIQRVWRGVAGRQYAVDYVQLQRACTIVQSRYRGHLYYTRYVRQPCWSVFQSETQQRQQKINATN